MSWILRPEGDGGDRVKRPTEPPPENDTPATSQNEVPASPWGEFPVNDEYPKVQDPAFKGRMVSTKQANRPFLG